VALKHQKSNHNNPQLKVPDKNHATLLCIAISNNKNKNHGYYKAKNKTKICVNANIANPIFFSAYHKVSIALLGQVRILSFSRGIKKKLCSSFFKNFRGNTCGGGGV
jgi:hypothetical protein